MSRVKPSTIPANTRNELLREFWEMIALLDNVNEVEMFFSDLLSSTEALMLARRVRIARLLLEGATYDEISETTHAASATIASVQRWLEDTNNKCTGLVKRLEKEFERKRKVKTKKKLAQQPNAQSFEYLKQRYPLHFLLLNLIDSYRLRTPKRLRKRS